MTDTASRYELQYPELFEQLQPAQRESIASALASDRLEHGTMDRDQVAVLVRSVTEGMSTEAFIAAVTQHAHA